MVEPLVLGTSSPGWGLDTSLPGYDSAVSNGTTQR
jgi:hypothetical protein